MDDHLPLPLESEIIEPLGAFRVPEQSADIYHHYPEEGIRSLGVQQFPTPQDPSAILGDPAPFPPDEIIPIRDIGEDQDLWGYEGEEGAIGQEQPMIQDIKRMKYLTDEEFNSDEVWVYPTVNGIDHHVRSPMAHITPPLQYRRPSNSSKREEDLGYYQKAPLLTQKITPQLISQTQIEHLDNVVLRAKVNKLRGNPESRTFKCDNSFSFKPGWSRNGSLITLGNYVGNGNRKLHINKISVHCTLRARNRAAALSDNLSDISELSCRTFCESPGKHLHHSYDNATYKPILDILIKKCKISGRNEELNIRGNDQSVSYKMQNLSLSPSKKLRIPRIVLPDSEQMVELWHDFLVVLTQKQHELSNEDYISKIEYEKLVWALINTLFGNPYVNLPILHQIPSNSPLKYPKFPPYPSPLLENKLRRVILGDWFQFALTNEIADEIHYRNDELTEEETRIREEERLQERVLTYLSGRQIKNAFLEALQAGQLDLGYLITQSLDCNSGKERANMQIIQWEESKTISRISVSYII